MDYELLDLLGDATIDPNELEFTIASLRQQRSLNLSLELMEKRHRAEEDLDRINNPRNSAFFDRLAAARIAGMNAGYGF